MSGKMSSAGKMSGKMARKMAGKMSSTRLWRAESLFQKEIHSRTICKMHGTLL